MVRVFEMPLELFAAPQMNFLNLTNGIQALEDYGPDVLRPYSFLRLQSTWCEQKRWADILTALPDDFLVRAALGEEILVLDYGAHADVPRAVWQGLEWVKYALCRRWYERDYIPAGRAGPMRRYFAVQYEELDIRVMTRLAYFGKFSTGVLDIRAKCGRSRYDGQYDVLASLLRRYHDDALPVSAG